MVEENQPVNHVMFKISEFAKIAHINPRLLRHYDTIGLFTPAYTDPDTGYRYYRAAQLSDLNRIVVLKELGFSLEQVRRLMHESIALDELEAMLQKQKQQVEQTLLAEQQRLQHIQSRLYQLQHEGTLAEEFNIVLKAIPDQCFASIRQTVPNFVGAVDLFHQIRCQKQPSWGYLVAMDYTQSFVPDEPMDVEMGFLVDEANLDSVTEPFTIRTLPGCETMATIVQTGNTASHLPFGVLGAWMDTQGYHFAGLGREMYLQHHSAAGTTVIEHQIPVQKAPHHD